MNTIISHTPASASPASSGSSFRETMWNATRALTVLIGFSIPVSTSLAEIATGLFMACFLLAGDLPARWRAIRQNPVALGSLGMFGLLLAGLAWSSAEWPAALRCLTKYREFLYLPMLVAVLRDPRLRLLGIRAFMAGAALVLTLSYTEWLFGLDLGMQSAPSDHVVAKDRIIHSLLMSLLVYFSAQELAQGSRPRWIYGGLIAAAVPNIVFLVQGRTGYMLLALLTTLVLYQRWRLRGLVLAGVLVGATGVLAWSCSSAVRGRVAQTMLQLRNQFGPEKKHSPDPRLEFYENTLRLVARHPWMGTGTGSFPVEYARVAPQFDAPLTSDPHNEYLLLAAQLGVPGTVCFVALLALQWLLARRLPEREMRLAQGIVVAIAAGCLFNSLILSITGGLVFSYFGGMAFAALRAGMSAEAAPQSGDAHETARRAA